jgi:hypothetical protein
MTSRLLLHVTATGGDCIASAFVTLYFPATDMDRNAAQFALQVSPWVSFPFAALAGVPDQNIE